MVNISTFKKKVEINNYLVFLVMGSFLVLSVVPLIVDFVLVKQMINNTRDLQQSLLTSQFIRTTVMIEQG